MTKWNSDMDAAPRDITIRIRVGEAMEFEAILVTQGSMNAQEEFCDQWRAEHEGEHPPCWSAGACWENNEDEYQSMQPNAWMHLPKAPS